jgi:prolyl oligopeptidase
VQFPTAGGALAWTGEGPGFWCTRYPGADAPEVERHFNQALYLHRIGHDVAQNKPVLGAANGLPRTAEIYLDGSRDCPFAVALLKLSDGGQFMRFVLKPDSLRSGSAVSRIKSSAAR